MSLSASFGLKLKLESLYFANLCLPLCATFTQQCEVKYAQTVVTSSLLLSMMDSIPSLEHPFKRINHLSLVTTAFGLWSLKYIQ